MKNKTDKPRPCKALSRPETAAERTERLAERRVRQRARAPGFRPIYNARIDQMISAQQAMLVMSGAYNAVEAQAEARRRVARALPAPPMTRSSRARPSKSDSAEYRRGNR